MMKISLLLLVLSATVYGDFFNPTCNFENTYCYKAPYGRLQWSRTDSGRASQGRNYFTLSGDGDIATFELRNSVFYNGLYTVSFHYFMKGTDYGTLNMYVKSGNSKQKITSVSGLQHEWSKMEEDVEMQKNDRIVFEFKRGKGAEGRLGLDDIKVLGKKWKCYGNDKTSCDGNKCSKHSQCLLTCDGLRLGAGGNMYKCECDFTHMGVYCDNKYANLCVNIPANCMRCSYSSQSVKGYFCYDQNRKLINTEDRPKTT